MTVIRESEHAAASGVVDTAMAVVVFTCEGRERLLARTWQSFGPCFAQRKHNGGNVLLAMDGRVNRQIIDAIDPDVLIQSARRRGYVRSLINVMGLIDTEFFFWLEDDWELNQDFDPSVALSMLMMHPDWVQVRLSKVAPLTAADRVLAPGISFSSVGFSANPSICRTSYIRDALRELQSGPRDQHTFEGFIDRWIEERGLVCAVLDPGNVPAVCHLGALEPTDRAWHKTESLDVVPQGQSFNFASPARWRRLWMLAKLTRAFTCVGLRQFFDDAEYDLAFRMVAATKSQGARYKTSKRMSL